MPTEHPGADGAEPAAAGPVRRDRSVCDDGLAYLVRRGTASLFVEAAGQAGTPHFIASLESGQAAFGVPASQVRLVLLPADDAIIEAVGLEDLAAQRDSLARLADGWIALITDRAEHILQDPADTSDATSLPPAHRLVAGDNALPAGTLAAPAGDGVLWCRRLAGDVRTAWGHGDDGRLLPVTRFAPLHVETDSRVAALSSMDLASRGALLEALRAFDAALGARLEAWWGRRRAAFTQRIATLADADASALAAAMSALGAGRTGTAVLPGSGLEAPLLAVMRLVAEAVGAALPAPGAGGGPAGSESETIKVLASNAGLRSRQVRLREGWWREAGEGMVGRLRDGTPVALLPTGRRWQLVRPGDARPRPVDRTTAATLEDHAYVLYRRFDESPERPGRALFSFVVRAVRGEMALVGVASLLAAVLGMATPFLSGMLIQSIIPDGVRSEIAQLVVTLLAVSFGVIGFELVRGLAVLRIESILGSSIEAALWNRLLRMPARFFRQFGAGDLAMRADAINQMRRTMGYATITALIGVVFSSVNLVVLLSYGLYPALLAIGVCVVEVAILAGMALFDVGIQRRAMANGGAMQTLTVQIFEGMSKLRVAAAESRFLARWTRLFAVDQSLHFRANVVGGAVTAFGAAWNITVMAAVIGLVGFGGAKMSLGDYVTYSGIFGQFVSATLSLAGIIPALAAMIPLWERARPILAEPIEDAGGRIQPGILQGDMEVTGVTFSHAGGQPALRDVSLRIRAGSLTAIVGPSGSGKSTLIRLLVGFEQPDSGSILLDGHDLRDLDTGAVRRQLGVVLQHSRIEAGSLYRNIAGAASLTMEEAWEAARLVGLASDIAAMPMGIHTYVNDSASTLSGGQRQRLLLARAIARRPRIMLLDEATSALDNATQAQVMDTLSRMNVTRVVVAHRLSTVRDADAILVMSEGRIVEQGRFETLARSGGVFTELVRRQMART